VVDLGEGPAGVFVVMEYVPGDAVSGLVRKVKGRLPLSVSLRMGRKSKYPPEVRERAVRLVFAQLGSHDSEWSTLSSIAG
jgi:hypothetical protein